MSIQPQPSSSMVRPEEPPELERIKRMLGPFRMLIIGRANAGKTTILQKICNSTEDPKILDHSGKEVSSRLGFPNSALIDHSIFSQVDLSALNPTDEVCLPFKSFRSLRLLMSSNDESEGDPRHQPATCILQ